MTEEQLEKAIATHARRRKVFMENGLNESDAWDLAERMFTRDKEKLDDRRVCFECVHLKGRECHGITDRFGKPTTQMRFILQRCPSFKLKGKPLTDEERNQIDASLQHQERDE
jgi:hypothetical protein